MSPESAVVTAAIGGAIISGVAVIVTTFLSQYYEERRTKQQQLEREQQQRLEILNRQLQSDTLHIEVYVKKASSILLAILRSPQYQNPQTIISKLSAEILQIGGDYALARSYAHALGSEDLVEKLHHLEKTFYDQLLSEEDDSEKREMSIIQTINLAQEIVEVLSQLRQEMVVNL